MSHLGHQPLSPLDGRYREATQELGEFFSEAALNRARVRVEIEWLITLCHEGVAGTTPLPADTITALRALSKTLGLATSRSSPGMKPRPATTSKQWSISSVMCSPNRASIPWPN